MGSSFLSINRNNSAFRDILESTNKSSPDQNLPPKVVANPPPANQNAKYEQNSQADLVRHHLQDKLNILQATTDDLNGLSEFKAVPIEIKKTDSQADVLRRTYETFARQADLSEEGQTDFIETMIKSGDNLIHHDDTGKAYTANEFLRQK